MTDDDASASTIPLQRPRVNHVVVYRLAMETPAESTSFAPIDGTELHVAVGPFGLRRSVPVRHYGQAAAAMTLATETVPLPLGAYLVVAQTVDIADTRTNPARRASEIAALLDLAFEGLIVEKSFEGVVSQPNVAAFVPEGPIQLVARPPVSLAEIETVLIEGTAALTSLQRGARERLGLMARWYRRARETMNQIDRFLFLYVVLEVYPAAGTTDVPNAVRDFLQERFFPDVDRGLVKERLELGRLAGLRAGIVHDGKSSVESSEMDEFSRKLELLEAVARVCLRELAGGDYDGALDRWVRL